MRTRLIPLLAAVAAVTMLLTTAPAVTRAAEPLHADPVVQWNQHATDVLITASGQPPQQAVVHLAMVHAAVYDAVNAIDGTREGYLLTRRLARPTDSKEAAVATAAHDVLASIVPAQQATLDAHQATALDAIPDGPAKVRGIAVGRAAAAAMVAARTDDGRYGPFRFSQSTDVGRWRPVPPALASDPNAWLKDVTPFVLARTDQFPSPAPPALDSRRYARDYAEVQAVGSLTSTVRTADQTDAARYWADGPHASVSRLLRTIAAQQGLSTSDSARMFAEAYLAGADALIAVWREKEQFSYWRPITAIHEGAADPNGATTGDPSWQPLIATPPYPEYPSGLTSLTSAVVTSLQAFFRTDRIGLSDTHPGLGITRTYARLSHITEETVNARIWSGIHFRTADERGAALGRQVALWRAWNYLRPIPGR
jgi:hypothetical protein